MKTRASSKRASRVLNAALKLSSGVTVRHGVVDDAVRHDTTLECVSVVSSPAESSFFGHRLVSVFGCRHARCALIGSQRASTSALDAGASGKSLATWRVTANGRRSRARPSGRNGGGDAEAAAFPFASASSSPASSAGASKSRTPMTTRLYPANAVGNGVPPLASSTSYTRSATRVDPSTSDASSIGTVDVMSSPLVSSPVSASLLVSPSRVNVTASRAPPSLAIARTTSSFTAHSCIGPVQSSHGTMPADSRVTTSGCSSCVETNSVPSGRVYATVMDALGGSSLAGSSPSSAGVSAGVSAGSSAGSSAAAASVSAAASSCGWWRVRGG